MTQARERKGLDSTRTITQSSKQRQSRGGSRAGGGSQEESADKSVNWSGAELEGLAMVEEATNAGGGEGVNLTADGNHRGTQESGAGEISVDTASRGGNTGKGKPPLKPLTGRDQEAVMGRGQG